MQAARLRVLRSEYRPRRQRTSVSGCLLPWTGQKRAAQSAMRVPVVHRCRKRVQVYGSQVYDLYARVSVLERYYARRNGARLHVRTKTTH